MKRLTLDLPGISPWKQRALNVIAPLFERLIALPRLNRLYDEVVRDPSPRSFPEKWLAALGIGFHVDPAELARIPRTGPLVVVANHPFGIADGIILLTLLQRVRPDVKILTNHFMHGLREARENMILVDPFTSPDAARRNRASLRAALEWLAGGGVIGVFPAGEVAHYRLRDRRVVESPWIDTVGRIIQRTGADALPILFDGTNGPWFHLAGLLHPRLRTVLLTRELLNKKSRVVRVEVGALIPFARLSRFDDPQALTDYLRLRTEVLRARVPSEPVDAVVATAPAAPRFATPVAPPMPADQVARDVAGLPRDALLVTSGALEVYCFRASQAPALLREIGRLRELSFRAAGEGSGRAIDLDAFDEFYWHLCVWDRAAGQLVGAYRAGPTDEILPARGVAGLYTHTLFHYGDRLMQQLGPALELGRSFVVPQQQRSYGALLSLWKGIGRLCVRHPRYRNLFGAVSISAEYQSTTRQLLMTFLRANRFRDDLARLVTPRNPPRLPRPRRDEQRMVSTVVRDLADVDELVSEIERDRRGMPTLIRQYLKMNARLLGFNVDPEFSDVLDGLILVDLCKSDRPLLDRYLGPEGAASFLAYHGFASGRTRCDRAGGAATDGGEPIGAEHAAR